MSSIVLTSDTLDVTPTIGSIEHNGKIFTATPQSSNQRGIVPTEQFFRLNANLVGANAIGAQNIFGVGVTLAGGTVYEFELFYQLSKTTGITSHTISLGFGGTATINNLLLSYPAASQQLWITSVASQVVTGVITTAANTQDRLIIKGTVSVNAGGTFIPQYSLSAAPGGAYSTIAGSYMKIKPIGASGANIAVGTWS